ncbi:MAG: hypothetical protein ACJ79K_07310 [Gemmatimonadaceae bacterium]
MPLDPLSTGASAVTILDRVLAAARALFRRGAPATDGASPSLRKRLATTKAVRPDGYELFPIHFEIGLTQELPQLTVWMLAINYTKKPLQLDTASISYFHLSGGPSLEQIQLLNAPRVEGGCARQIAFRRVLADSEIRALLRSQPQLPETAAMNLTSHGRTGRKERVFMSSAKHIAGWITRPPRE